MLSRPTHITLCLLMLAAALMISGGWQPLRADPQREKVRIVTGDGELAAVLYRPQGSGPFPAVVALHGCGGLLNHSGEPSARHDDWGLHLARQGIMALMPDSFGSRGLGSQCGVQNRLVRSGRERVADARAAKDWLQERDDVKRGSVSLLGWSNGASTVLATVRIDKSMTAKGPDFARAVAFYPGCRNAVESGRWATRMPLLILMGDADDWTPPGPCEELTRSAKARGEQVDLLLYKGAYHNFDHPSLETRTRTGLAFTADGSGTAHVGTDPAARADALVKVPAFLLQAR